MKRTILAVAATAMLFGVLGTGAQAAGKKGDPPCTVNPSPVSLNQAYTISATGLPTTSPVYLVVTRPDGTSAYYGSSSVTVSASGTWSSVTASGQTGLWKYAFDGALNNKYATVSSCSVQVG